MHICRFAVQQSLHSRADMAASPASWFKYMILLYIFLGAYFVGMLIKTLIYRALSGLVSTYQQSYPQKFWASSGSANKSRT